MNHGALYQKGRLGIPPGSMASFTFLHSPWVAWRQKKKRNWREMRGEEGRDDYWTWTDLVLDDVSTDFVSAVVSRRQPRHATRCPRHIGHLRHRGWSGPSPRILGGHGGRRRRRVAEPGARLGRHAELVGLSVQQAQHPEAGTDDRLRTDTHPRQPRDETLLHVVADHRSSTVTGRRRPRDRT